MLKIVILCFILLFVVNLYSTNNESFNIDCPYNKLKALNSFETETKGQCKNSNYDDESGEDSDEDSAEDSAEDSSYSSEYADKSSDKNSFGLGYSCPNGYKRLDVFNSHNSNIKGKCEMR